MTDLTLVVTAHNESYVAGPTIRAADVAAEAARERGFTVQQILALAEPTESAAAYFGQEHFAHWDRRTLAEGDLGAARNAIVAACDGDYIAFLAADEIPSANLLAAGLETLREGQARGERLVASPELEVTFDRRAGSFRRLDQRSPLFTPYYFYLSGCYGSGCISPREAHLDVPFPRRDLLNGLALEDLQHVVETMARGFVHVVVPDTIIFRRGWDNPDPEPRAVERAVMRSLPELGADCVRELAGG